MSEDTKQYEISLVLSTEDACTSIISFLKEKIEKVLQENPARRIRLAYPIKKAGTGFFTWTIVSALPSVIPPLQKDLEANPLVLRALIITPPLPAKTERRSPGLRGKVTKDKPKRELTRPSVAKEERETRSSETLTNELLEKKLEEILK